ncbi:MAG: septum formation initiator family protein [Succinivibrio sp.]
MGMKVFALVMLVFILVLGYDTMFGRNGIEQYHHTQEQLAAEENRRELLERRNQALEDEIADLRQGKKVTEDLARSELGMVKKDETFYRVIEKKTTDSTK